MIHIRPYAWLVSPQLTSVQHYIQYTDDFQVFLKQFVSKYLKLFSQVLKSGMVSTSQKQWSGGKSNTTINNRTVNSQDERTKKTASLQNNTETPSYTCCNAVVYYANQPPEK